MLALGRGEGEGWKHRVCFLVSGGCSKSAAAHSHKYRTSEKTCPWGSETEPTESVLESFVGNTE